MVVECALFGHWSTGKSPAERDREKERGRERGIKREREREREREGWVQLQ